MTANLSPRIDHHFASLNDPRRAKVTHLLINIVTIALCATIAGADDCVAMATWARQHQQWLCASGGARSPWQLTEGPRPLW